jgi:hypothetical protein
LCCLQQPTEPLICRQKLKFVKGLGTNEKLTVKYRYSKAEIRAHNTTLDNFAEKARVGETKRKEEEKKHNRNHPPPGTATTPNPFSAPQQPPQNPPFVPPMQPSTQPPHQPNPAPMQTQAQ